MPRRLVRAPGRWGYRLAWRALRLWWAVRRPRSAGVRCVLRRDGNFVLVRHTYGDSRWMLPGGRVRRGEDPVQTAMREMSQELGVVASQWREIGYLGARRRYRRRSRAEGYRRHATHYVAADVESPVLRPRPGELTDAGWFGVDRLPGDVSDALDVAMRRGWLP